MKMLVVFKKSPRLRFIGHLDLMRTMQRALRRSDLPVRYSQGFNPHMQLNFASPLSVGISGEREIMEIPIEGEMSAEKFKQILSDALPLDLPCISVRCVEDTHPAPMASCKAAEYRCIFEQPVNGLSEKMDAFLAQNTILAVKHTKSGEKECDIRPMIRRVSVLSDSELTAVLDLCETSTCKPELMLGAFAEYTESSLPPVNMVRAQMYGEAGSELVPLESL